MNDNDNDYEEKLFYGGQVSAKHPIYQDIAQLASAGFIWWFLGKATDPKWKEKKPLEKIQEIIYASGQIEFINNSSELTKLSAIMGDTRKRYDQRGLKDELSSARVQKSSEP